MANTKAKGDGTAEKQSDAAQETGTGPVVAAAALPITTGALAKDDGVRTEHGAHPMDPMYLGTKIAETDGAKQAEDYRADRQKAVEAAEAPLRDVPAKEQPAAEEKQASAA